MWQSILSVKSLLEYGMRKRIGDGKSVIIWQDRWLLNKWEGKGRTKKPQNCSMRNVSQLIQGNHWNKQVLDILFAKEDRAEIEKIPVSECGGKDKIFWVHSSNGEYTVKSGYKRKEMMGDN